MQYLPNNPSLAALAASLRDLAQTPRPGHWALEETTTVREQAAHDLEGQP